MREQGLAQCVSFEGGLSKSALWLQQEQDTKPPVRKQWNKQANKQG